MIASSSAVRRRTCSLKMTDVSNTPKSDTCSFMPCSARAIRARTTLFKQMIPASGSATSANPISPMEAIATGEAGNCLADSHPAVLLAIAVLADRLFALKRQETGSLSPRRATSTLRRMQAYPLLSWGRPIAVDSSTNVSSSFSVRPIPSAARSTRPSPTACRRSGFRRR